MMKNYTVEEGTKVAPEKFHITITEKGPYLVFGNPPLVQQFIMLNSESDSWFYKEGRSFQTKDEPTALCRCGASKNKPYCDGSHIHADWTPDLTASMESILKESEVFEGQNIILTDNEDYCAFARFCDAKGRTWNLVDESSNPHKRELAIREANHCPAGRITVWDRVSGAPYRPTFKPSLGLIEDPAADCSGPLWVRAGIPLIREDGRSYEVRNMVTLCRCGQSSNKPFCDGTHASFKFKDELDGFPDGIEY